MKKLFTIIFSLILLISQSSSAVISQSEFCIENPDDPSCQPGRPINERLDETAIDRLNPLVQYGDPTIDLSTPGAVLSRVLFFAFPLAGIILFVMLIWAGFEMVSGATEKKSQDAGKQRATAAVIGFVLLFVSYWIIKILEIVTGAKIF